MPEDTDDGRPIRMPDQRGVNFKITSSVDSRDSPDPEASPHVNDVPSSECRGGSAPPSTPAATTLPKRTDGRVVRLRTTQIEIPSESDCACKPDVFGGASTEEARTAAVNATLSANSTVPPVANSASVDSRFSAQTVVTVAPKKERRFVRVRTRESSIETDDADYGSVDEPDGGHLGTDRLSRATWRMANQAREAGRIVSIWFGSAASSGSTSGHSTARSTRSTNFSAFSAALGISPSLRTSRALTTTLPEELLRGVSLAEVMSNRGKHLLTNEGAEGDFERSAPTEYFHDFISHDWRTPAWQKYLSLCIIYNMPAAMVISLVAGLCLGVSQMDALAVLPVFWPMEMGKTDIKVAVWGAAICPLSYLSVLLSWQWLRLCLCSSKRTVFLDKLCIHQTDEAMKEEAIRGLAAFLVCSERMVVLWSPRYFTRLWCAYELAAWCYLQKGDARDGLYVFPVATVGYMALVGTVNYVLLMWFDFILPVTPGMLGLGVFAAVMLLTFLMCMRFLRKANSEIADMHTRLSSFNVHAAHCHCCDVQHVTPSGKQLLCDRRLIYKQLSDWLIGEAEQFAEQTAENHLRHFNRIIRTEVSSRLLSKAGLSYWQSVCVALPHLWAFSDRFFRLLEVDAKFACHQLVSHMVLTVVVVPSLVRFGFFVAAQLDRSAVGRCQGLSDLVVSLVIVSFVFIIWTPHYVAATSRSWTLQLSYHALEALAMCLLYRLQYNRRGPLAGCLLLLPGGKAWDLRACKSITPAASSEPRPSLYSPSPRKNSDENAEHVEAREESEREETSIQATTAERSPPVHHLNVSSISRTHIGQDDASKLHDGCVAEQVRPVANPSEATGPNLKNVECVLSSCGTPDIVGLVKSMQPKGITLWTL
eukprot:TRINITY_DN29756_c0_g1_i1.p1 TRINITY_DN29756_c0_g1~~TRINITY_DN29756_c0_g1_i1.p1  ORF type:complete len:876 (-),score=120.24 TRINITY_DN29756_c0_g1_i1:85-2712(-)